MDVYCKLSHDTQMTFYHNRTLNTLKRAKYVIWLFAGVMQNMNVI
jgi:hypothetical protein